MPLRLHGERHALGLCAFLAFGCGPNVQLVYEGNVRFEHCYRLDLDPTIASSHRKACWNDYLARHTYAQSGDRVGYARQRLKELTEGRNSVMTLDLDGGLAVPARAESVPMPSNIHAAPPPRAPEPPASAPSQTVVAKIEPPLPEVECSSSCASRWDECLKSCESSAAASPDPQITGKTPIKSSAMTAPKNQKDGCSDCKKAFKTCMQRCYR